MIAWILALLVTTLATVYVAGSEFLHNNPGYYKVALVSMMWIPGIVALCFAKMEGISLKIFRPLNRVPFVAGLTALFIAVGSFLFSYPFGEYWGFEFLKPQIGDSLEQFQPAWLADLAIYAALALSALVAGVTINMLAALGEELMWRGYLWEHWRRHGLVKYLLWSGLAWGIWHWPMILLLGFQYPNQVWIGLGAMVLLCLLLSPLHLYFRLRGGSLLAPSVFHGTLNAIAPLALLIFKNPDTLVVGIAGAAGMAFLALINLFFWERLKKLSRQKMTA